MLDGVPRQPKPLKAFRIGDALARGRLQYLRQAFEIMCAPALYERFDIEHAATIIVEPEYILENQERMFPGDDSLQEQLPRMGCVEDADMLPMLVSGIEINCMGIGLSQSADSQI